MQTWRDSKKPWWMLSLVVPLLPFAGWTCWLATGASWSWWLTPVMVFVVIPVVDGLFGDDRSNPPEAIAAWLQQLRYYRWITYAYIPLQYCALILGAAVWHDHTLPAVAATGLIVSTGIVNGIAINTAHELGHKRERLERRLAKIALAPAFYGHFQVEHNRGHHVRVATKEDPATARYGESLWAFLPRTVWGSLRSAWRLESDRLRVRRRRVWTLKNDVLQAWLLSAFLYAALVVIYGPAVLTMLVAQAVIAFGLLEAVNYLEHYGLLRARNASGRYEKVDARHSWNSDRVVTNLFLFQLQRHSDHHSNPVRRYQALRTFSESPQLPHGYATMILLALVPALWRRTMHPILARHLQLSSQIMSLPSGEAFTRELQEDRR